MAYITKENNFHVDNHRDNFIHEYFLSQLNCDYGLEQFNNMISYFQKMKLNTNDIRTTTLNLNEFHSKYKKLSHPSSLLPYNIMKNHPIFSNFVSNIDLQIKVDELRKENIELKKQLTNTKK